MACYDCDDCNKHISKGGKCTLWANHCPLDKIITNQIERKEMEETISFINKKIEYLKNKQDEDYSCKFDNAILYLKNAVLELEDTIDEDMLDLYKIVYKEEK